MKSLILLIAVFQAIGHVNGHSGETFKQNISNIVLSLSPDPDTESCEDVPNIPATGYKIVQGEIGTLFIDEFQKTLT